MVNFKKNLKILVSYWREIIFLIIVVPIIFIGLTRVLFFILPGGIIGEKSNWVSFSGSYIAVIGAVGAVGLQIKNEKEKEKLKKEEKEKEEYYKNLKKELYGVVSFLIVFRESCEDNCLFYKELKGKYSEEEIKQNKNLIKESPHKIKEELFFKFLQDIEIENRNRCIELLYLLERLSYKYSFLYFENYFGYLEFFYNKLNVKTNKILTEYENLKYNEKNYLDIISNRILSDLNSLAKEVNKYLKKMDKKRKKEKKALY